MAMVSSQPVVHEMDSTGHKAFEVAGRTTSSPLISCSYTNTPIRDQFSELGSPSPAILTSAIGSEETLFVAVSKEVNECKSTVEWAIKHGGGRKIGILHVHQLAQGIPTPMGKFPAQKCTPKQVEMHREEEKKNMQDRLDEYRLICARSKVESEKIFIETEDTVEKGILDLVIQHGINLLVMGAAADKHYSPRTKLPKSKKAIAVSRSAPLWCNIWFICDGKLVCSREAGQHGTGVYVTPPSPVTPSRSPAFFPTALSRSTTGASSHSLHDSIHSISSGASSRSSSVHLKDLGSILSPSNSYGGSSTHNAGGDDQSDETPGNSTSTTPAYQDAGYDRKTPNQVECEIQDCRQDQRQSSLLPYAQMVGANAEEDLFEQLQQSMLDANNCRRDAYEESVKRRSAEKQALEASLKVKQSESAYLNEMKRRKEIEEKLAQETLNLEAITTQYKQQMEELQRARDLQTALEKELADSCQTTVKLTNSLSEARQNLDAVRAELETCKREKEEAIKIAEGLHNQIDDTRSSSIGLEAFSQFAYSEIEEATRGLHDSLKIGGGGYGSVYEGLLRHIHVAIKILNPDSRQGENEFKYEMEILTRVRHPNLVTLIGTCPEAKALIYEYLPNGSLEDRLLCKHNTPPLSWQARVRILYEVCSALVFLHSVQPHCVVHGDLKPANILLDTNFVAKLGDFGIARLIPRRREDVTGASPGCTSTLGWITDPKGTFAYIDPEFMQSGFLTPRSDVYSFGVVILRVLTKSPAMGIVKEVKQAVDNGELDRVLDGTAGGWPSMLAKQLAELGLKCCEMNRKERPHLESEVWSVLEQLKKYVVAARSEEPVFPNPGPKKVKKARSCFPCPKFQQVIQDPQGAANGFPIPVGISNEGRDTDGRKLEAARGSPICMTNRKLSHMQELILIYNAGAAIQNQMTFKNFC